MTCTAGNTLVLRKQYKKLTELLAPVWTAQWRQPVLSVWVWGTPFSGCRGCRGFIAENLCHCIQRCYCWSSWGALHHRQKQQGPTTTATCYVISLSQARGGWCREGVLKCRSSHRGSVGWFPTNTIYCPLAHSNPMPFLVQKAKRQMQPTTRRCWTYAMICVVPYHFGGCLKEGLDRIFRQTNDVRTRRGHQGLFIYESKASWDIDG
jgi:hypothetical protein